MVTTAGDHLTTAKCNNLSHQNRSRPPSPGILDRLVEHLARGSQARLHLPDLLRYPADERPSKSVPPIVSSIPQFRFRSCRTFHPSAIGGSDYVTGASPPIVTSPWNGRSLTTCHSPVAVCRTRSAALRARTPAGRPLSPIGASLLRR
jgi:hypothetical protein